MRHGKKVHLSQDDLDLMLEKHRLFLMQLRTTGKAHSGRLSLEHHSFRELDFCASDLSESCFRRCDFRRADLVGCLMEHAIVRECNFSNAMMFGIRITHSDLQHSRLNGADLAKANIKYSTLDNITAKGVNLTEAKIANSSLYAADLSKAIMRDTEMFILSADGVFFEGTIIEGGVWHGVEMRGSTIHLASLGEVEGIDVLPASIELGSPILVYTGAKERVAVYQGRHRGFDYLEMEFERKGQKTLAAALRFYKMISC